MLAVFLVVLLCIGLAFRGGLDTSSGGGSLSEQFHSGTRTAADKVAIVTVDGVIMEGLLSHAHKQLAQAAKDSRVKAVVLRINSPGGSISASDDLHRRIIKLRDGDDDQDFEAKPVVVSMGSLAASGGYYVAAPARKIFAERSTLTGSIGVYSMFPNLEELAKKLGVNVQLLKAGKLKDAGSLFRAMKPEEEQVLADMVDHAYAQFLDVITTGRPALTRSKLLERFEVKPLRPDPQAKQPLLATYTRYRADGGIFTAQKALDLGLVDAIGPLDEAAKAAAELAGLDAYRAVRYQKPRTIGDLLLGVQARQAQTPTSSADRQALDALRTALTPRLWYIAPGYEAAALLAAEASP